MDIRKSLWASGRDEEVQVNQRALIDKVLARYAGEYTVLRELLQNSDDAGAKTVEIHFNTNTFLKRRGSKVDSEKSSSRRGSPALFNFNSKLPDLTKESLHQWEFRNDGSLFREEDWNRLKKIAEGNPDEEKIGAFGVGFYSLFSVTDEPFVTSGDQWMGFYWKANKDQLIARRGKQAPAKPAAANEKQWTTFLMPLREASPFPGRPVDIARFLATSLTFVRNLRDVSMFFNEHRLVQIKKNAGVSKSLTLPPSAADLDPRTRIAETMVVKEVQSSDLQMEAQVLRWVYSTGSEKTSTAVSKPAERGGFFGSIFSSSTSGTASPVARPSTPVPATPLPDALETLESSVRLTVYSAKIESKLDQKSIAELERATRKKPPSTCWYSIIYTGKDEFDTNEEDQKEFKAVGSVFQGLRADLNGAGTARVFIGHATSQSTGIGGHISARFIPTVERESIDLVDRQVSVWNRELLWVGGYLCRFIYESQLAIIQSLWDESTKFQKTSGEINAATRELLESKAIHALKFFAFHPTTPSAVVGLNMEEAFFACAKDKGAFPIISSTGVKPVSQVRSYCPKYGAFLKNTPMLTESVVNAVPLAVNALRERGLVRDITFEEVLQELGQRPLNEQEMEACLKWMIGLDTAGLQGHDEEVVRKRFLQAAVLSRAGHKEDGGMGERIIPLASIKTIISTLNSITPNFPTPSHTLPFSLSKRFPPDSLRRLFNWSDLTVVEWLEYILSPSNGLPNESNITTSAEFAEKVLNVTAKTWGSLSKQQMHKITEILQNKMVIPTNSGMKLPRESYFPNTYDFPDLPIIEMPKGTHIKGELEKLLMALGVRKHADLQIVFTRRIARGNWGVQDLMKYLVAIKETLTPLEKERLRETAAFPQESATSGPSKPTRKKPGELYEPTSTLRELELPILDWGVQHKWRPKSEEAKMLFEFGLRKFPPLEVILQLASNPATQRNAFGYLLENFDSLYSCTYDPDQVAHLAFIPSIESDGTAFLARPGEVFTNPECGSFGFALVETSLRNASAEKLGVLKDPSATFLVSTLIDKPPNDPTTARKLFEYLTTRIADFTPEAFGDLRLMKIVPAVPKAARLDVKEKHADKTWVLYKPGECFIRSDAGGSSVDLYSKLFTFVDFGGKANVFLKACGVKDKPNVHEIAEMMIRDPQRFLELAGGPQEYLDELRQVAAQQYFDPTLFAKMRTTPFLLGSRRTPKAVKDTRATNSVDVNEEEEEDYEVVFDLLCPNQIVIVDDTNAYSLFSEFLWSAPQGDIFEGFYHSLGCHPLTSLVSEENHPQQVEGNASAMAKGLRKLVLERFPLFVHARDLQCTVKTNWLEEGSNFVVRGCRKLNVVRKLNLDGKIIRQSQEVSAAADLPSDVQSFGPLTLFFSQADEVDMFEVAYSICRVLLKKPKVDDSLLFMTILSTSLRALRRRGFNVDRVLHQQRVQRDLPQDQQVEAQKEEQKALSTPRNELAGVTPASDIEKNIQAAINACRSQNSSVIENRQHITPVKESLKDGYCDIMGAEADLTLVGTIQGYRVYVSRDIENPRQVAVSRQTALGRFASAIITPLRDVYKLPTTSINIFYDQKGDLMAFNRAGSLFMNLRYSQGKLPRRSSGGIILSHTKLRYTFSRLVEDQ
ncbi:hypothetical protein FS837_010600 [Tulasnella sp. UAMH 9824]|nr:hypothetical protein FS837_010600 [Tulasnella sp. UAMH 9824]